MAGAGASGAVVVEGSGWTGCGAAEGRPVETALTTATTTAPAPTAMADAATATAIRRSRCLLRPVMGVNGTGLAAAPSPLPSRATGPATLEEPIHLRCLRLRP